MVSEFRPERRTLQIQEFKSQAVYRRYLEIRNAEEFPEFNPHVNVVASPKRRGSTGSSSSKTGTHMPGDHDGCPLTPREDLSKRNWK